MEESNLDLRADRPPEKKDLRSVIAIGWIVMSALCWVAGADVGCVSVMDGMTHYENPADRFYRKGMELSQVVAIAGGVLGVVALLFALGVRGPRRRHLLVFSTLCILFNALAIAAKFVLT